MKKRKILLGLALASAMVFSLSACGDDTEPTTPSGDTPTDNGNTPTPDTPTPNTPTEQKIKLIFKDGNYTVKVEDEFVVGSQLQGITKNGYTFEGWYTEAALQNKVTDTSALTDGQELYAKWTVPSGYESVDFQLLANDLEQGSLSADLPSGIFTIKKGAEIRNRIKTWTNPYNDSEKIETWTKSVKNGPIEFTAPGDGVLTMYLQNGSSSAATKKVKVTPSEGEAQLIEFSGANAVAPYAGGSPVVAINVNISKGLTYTIERGDGGTIDWYQLDIECVAEISAENGFVIANAGTVDFLEGEAFDGSKIKLNATYENGKIMPIDMTSTDVVINSSNYNPAVPGTYEISVQYKEYAAQTITVTVYDVQEVVLGFNETYKGASTTAGNTPYLNGKVKTVYELNDTLDTEHLSVIVNAKSADNTKTFSKIVKSNISYNNIDFTTAGEKDVVVTFTTNSQEFTADYKITVVNTEAYKDSNNNYVVTVDKNYTGIDGAVNGENGNTFKTISAALEFLASNRVTASSQKILHIGAGYYNEKIEITVPNLTIIGAGTCKATVAGDSENYDVAEYAGATIIEWDSLYGVNDESGYSQVTDSTATVGVRESAVNCTMKNVTLSNYYNSQAAFDARAEELVKAGLATKKVNEETSEVTYKFSEHRALALIVQADRFKMEDCSLLGFQDTVEFMTGRQYLKNCYISGTTDFIFGTNNTTYFDTCTIHTIKNADSDGGYITAFKGCNKGADDAILYGAVFNHCTFEADSTVATAKTAIGRPWGAYAAVMVMNSTIGNHVSKAASTGVSQGERYVAMNAKATDATVKFTEYNNTGDGAITATQAGVTLLDSTAAADYENYTKVFGTNNGKMTYLDAWDPTSTTVIIDDRTYYTFDNSINPTGTSYALEDFVLNKNDDVKTKTVNGITFDATNGNITKRTTSSNQDLVLQAGGAIKINVEANTSVTVVGYYSVHIDVNGTKTKAVMFTKFFDTATEVVITGVDGTTYLTKIIVNPNESAPEAATLTEIAVAGAKDTFVVGDSFESTGLTVKGTYSDGSYATLAETDYQVNSTNVDLTTAGTYTVTVTAGSVSKNYTVTVEEPSSETAIVKTTKLDFTSSDAVTKALNNAKVDYTSASIASNGDNSSFTGSFSFEVKAGAIVYVLPYKTYGNFQVMIDNDDTDLTTYTSTYTYVASADCKLTVIAVGQNYIAQVGITYPISEDYSWSFRTDTENGDEVKTTYNGVDGFEDGLYINAKTGKFAPRASQWAQFNNNTEITLTVEAGGTVEIACYSSNYTINGEAATSAKSTITTTTTTTIVIKSTDTGENGYIDYITVDFA